MALSGEILLGNSPDNLTITVYDASSGVILGHFANSYSPRKGITLVGNTFIAVAHISNTPLPIASLHLYDWCSSTALHRLPLPEPVSPIATTLDGTYVFCGGVSGYIHTLNLPSGNLHRSFLAHSKVVSTCIVDVDASFLISGGEDGTLCVFPLIEILDDNSQHLVTALYCFPAHISSITAIVDGCGAANIISCSLDFTCKFWSLTDGITLIKTVVFPCMLWCLALDSTESKFYVGGSDGCVYVGAVTTNKSHSSDQIIPFNFVHNGAVTSLAMLNEGQNLVSASEDGNIWIWEVETATVVRVIADGREMIRDVMVAKGVSDRCSGMKMRDNINEFKEPSLGYCDKEIGKPVRELGELKESLKVVVEDRKRAIDILEGTIATYQRLLRLMLKEAKGTTSTNHKGKDKGEE